MAVLEALVAGRTARHVLAAAVERPAACIKKTMGTTTPAPSPFGSYGPTIAAAMAAGIE